MSLKKALLAATVLSLPVAAQAQPITGLYIGGGVGANYREPGSETLSLRGPGGATSGGFDVKTNWGWTALGSIGWGFGNGLRVEIEGNYRNNAVRRVSGAVTSGGTVHQYGVMANALYDFNFLNLNVGGVGIVPYVGAGVGYGWNDWRNVNGRNGGAQVRVDDRDGQFAYQGIAGLAFGLDSVVPGLALTTEYRFYGTLEPELGATANLNGRAVAAGTYKPTNYNHSILAGLRYAFNAPRPAPVVAAPVAAAPAPARTYLVFFDWDRADLTERARQIIGEAAQNARAVSATRIEVSGHADRTGTAQYNQRLSVRRAEAVAAELVRRGIARNEITIQGFGFDRPLVPTAQGVREPQNRRVEIVLR
ncbi:OmpA family protein [Roseococcus pinisoli]|uniref:OmpA family protein n=1 Tax=Roseococcus pinisoli TaxID=2835040 RepID=A0ABS5Q826_9PROT|nr:OmpA family protein [Roseococcus pinisoli]MBS7809634.1 OmpA family protein [Roseococcus pinisoli]